MKSYRMLVACGGIALVVAAGGWSGDSASAAEQTQSSIGPLERQAKPVTPENPIPRRVNYEAPDFPIEASAAGARGTVTLTITLDELGRVAEARRTRVALTSKDPDVSLSLSGSTPEDEARFLVNHSVEQSNAVRAVAKAFTDAAIRSVQQWRYDPPANAPISFPVTVSFSQNGDAAEAGTPRSGLSSTGPENPGASIRVGGTIKEPKNIRRVAPLYPPEAQAAGVTGMVILEVVIGRDGRVTDARVLRSIPMLDQAAIDAVMQWEFTPTLLNGVPVPVIMTVTVNFTLG